MEPVSKGVLVSADARHDSGPAEVPSVEIGALTRRFGDRDVVRDFNLMMRVGDRIALCGPNGSGKTTIIRCIAGTLIPTSGHVLVGGHQAGSVAARRLVGVSMSHERSFYLRLTGWENLLFFARVRDNGRRVAERLVREIGEELELGAILEKRVDRCSTGMVQQLALARALLGEPPIIIMDEPTRSMDVDAIGRLWSAIERRPERALLIATHRDEDVQRCHDRVDLHAHQLERR